MHFEGNFQGLCHCCRLKNYKVAVNQNLFHPSSRMQNRVFEIIPSQKVTTLLKQRIPSNITTTPLKVLVRAITPSNRLSNINNSIS